VDGYRPRLGPDAIKEKWTATTLEKRLGLNWKKGGKHATHFVTKGTVFPGKGNRGGGETDTKDQKLGQPKAGDVKKAAMKGEGLNKNV